MDCQLTPVSLAVPHNSVFESEFARPSLSTAIDVPPAYFYEPAAYERPPISGVLDRSPSIRSAGSHDAKPQTARYALIARPTDFEIFGQSPFWRRLAQEVRREIVARNGAFELSFSWEPPGPFRPDELRPEFLDDILAGRLQGVVALGVSARSVREIESAGVPVVGFATDATWSVCIDSPWAIREGVRALAARGCRSIAFWRPARRRTGVGEDAMFLEGEIEHFRAAIQSSGLDYHPQLVRVGNLERGPALFSAGVTLEEEGYFTALQVLGSPLGPKPDGLLIMDDVVTRGALTALDHVNPQLKNKLQIATTANKGLPVLREPWKELITMEVDPAEIAQLLVEQLDGLIRGECPAERVAWIQPTISG